MRRSVLTLVLSVVFLVLIQGMPQARETGQDTTFILPSGATMEMVWIEPGTFMMGSPQEEIDRLNSESTTFSYSNEGPQHEVKITKGFWLGKYEVTQGQWEAVMGTKPWSGKHYTKANPNHAVSYISWNDVQAFIRKLNQASGMNAYRLPTEAEWEYACRAGTTTRYSFGDAESQLANYVWYRDNAWDVGEQYAHEVGRKLRNPWGLYDMHGNVYEWCQDWYGSYSTGAQTDPTGPSMSSIGVMRGGYFGSFARYVRSANRDHASPDNRNPGIGVRLLRAEP